MAQQVKIPPAGESITSATVAQWHVANGATVKRGELLATIETDKVSNELESEAAGALRILVQEGEEVAIGTVIAEIDAGAQEANPVDGEPAAEEAAPEEPAPEGHAEASRGPEQGDGPVDPNGEIYEIKVPAAGESITTATIAQWHKRDGESVRRGETLVTLETDKVSNELEAELEGILQILTSEGAEVEIGTLIGQVVAGETGTGGVPPSPGPGEKPAGDGDGKVNQEDQEETTPSPEASVGETPTVPPGDQSAGPAMKPDLTLVAEAPERHEEPAETSDGRTTRRRLSTMRRKIATQLVNIQQTAAILTTFNEADMSQVMRLRKQVQEDFVAKHGVKLGFMSFFVKAVVLAQKEVTALNSRIDGDELVENHFYDIGVAVGTEKGLVVPVVRDADQKSFAEIEQDILDYSMRAREGKIQLEDMRGGGFTISNGGVYGSLLSTPILNPPQSGILGMHTIQQRPVAVDGQVEIRPMMYLALSYDHRVVDGKGAVTFLIRIKEAIENPTRLLLEI